MRPDEGTLLADRFELGSFLGAGAFGSVWEALDRIRSERVALKLLRVSDPRALYRFKREFRSLADLRHPNLIQLYELHSDSAWFFTMEYLRHARSLGPERDWDRTLGSDGAGAKPVSAIAPALLTESESIESAFRQLAVGLHALHDAGKLHRDLKPSNVLVDADGRVVLVDFGLVTDWTDGAATVELAGTPVYMSPEQMSLAPLTPASDWYSMGVMMWESLVGEPLFDGPLNAIAEAKRRAPPDPRSRGQNVRADLADLCVALLSPAPADRPTGPDVLSALAARPRAVVRSSTAGSAPAKLVGREPELERLRAAFRTTSSGRSTAAVIRGDSGLGKTALARAFLTEVTTRHPATLVFEGRCYERERIPYNALDPLVDGLARWMARLPAIECRALVPRHRGALVSTFEVLGSVLPESHASASDTTIPDQAARRMLAGEALAELLGRAADERQVILFIDDLQWGDRDSDTLLRSLLRVDMPLMLLACSRDTSSDTGFSSMMGELGSDRHFDILLNPLQHDDAMELARRCLNDDTHDLESAARRVVSGAGGLPFLVERLAGWLSELGEPSGGTPDDLVRARARRLTDDARELLELACVAGHPIPLTELATTTGIPTDSPALAELESARLFVRSWHAGEEHGDVVHDRIREAVLDGLDEQHARALHLRWVDTLVANPVPDAERLAGHLLAAGQLREAADWAARAADAAREALAFDRAAEMYQVALSHGRYSSENELRLTENCAHALARAGRGPPAAEYFQRAAALASPDHRVVLLQNASRQLLASGRYEEGIRLARRVLADSGLRSTEGTGGALVRIGMEAIRLTRRGRGYDERREDQVSRELLARIDLCWSMTVGLMMIDPVQSADFSMRHLRMALDAGEPRRIARAMISDAAFSLALGRSRPQMIGLWGRARGMAERLDDPYLVGMAELMSALEAAGQTDWPLAIARADRAADIFRTQCVGAWLEINWTDTAVLKSLATIGDLAELGRRLPGVLRSARDRGDQLAASLHRADGEAAMLLGRDQPEQARECLNASMRTWTSRGFHVQHLVASQMQVRVLIYEGRGAEAWQAQRGTWRSLNTSLFLRVPFFGLETAHLSGAAAVHAARAATSESERNTRLREAERFAKRAEKLGLVCSNGVSSVILAGAAHVRGDDETALEHLRLAEHELSRAGAEPWTWGLRRSRGLLEGGDGGQALARTAEEQMRRFGIAAPEAMCRVMTPGFGPTEVDRLKATASVLERPDVASRVIP